MEFLQSDRASCRHNAATCTDDDPNGACTSLSATQIAMPLGGIGAGCICLNGYGGLQDFSIRNHPSTTALPEGYSGTKASFAILHIKGASPVTKLVEGPFPVLKIYDQGLQGEGYRRGGFEGFPRFQKCVFKGEYPFGEAKLTDSTVPLQVTLIAWNPFVPLDGKNSGIPCAILEYTLHNSSPHTVEYEFSYHLSHLAPGCSSEESNSRNTVILGRGVSNAILAIGVVYLTTTSRITYGLALRLRTELKPRLHLVKPAVFVIGEMLLHYVTVGGLRVLHQSTAAAAVHVHGDITPVKPRHTQGSKETVGQLLALDAAVISRAVPRLVNLVE